MAEHLCDFTSSDNANLHIWQWSYGQTVKLVGDNITAGMTVQWAYPGITGVDSRTITADGDDLVANIPNDALEQVGTIYGYIYYFTEAIGETRYIINITVRERASSDETGSTDDTPTWQQLLLDAQEAIDELSAIAVPSTAGDLAYINTTSNLQAEDVQEAIDEVVASMFAPVVDTWHDCVMGTFSSGTQAGSAKCRKDITGKYLEIYAYLPSWDNPSDYTANYLFLLPEGYRPSQRVDIAVYSQVPGTSANGYLVINTNGKVQASLDMLGNPKVYISPSYHYIKIPLTLPTL